MKIAMSPPRVWDSTWGQEKNLVEVLNKGNTIYIIDLIDYSLRYSSIGKQFPIPKNVVIKKRKTRLGPGIILGIYSEIRNLIDFFRQDYDLFINYNTLGNVLVMFLNKLRGKKALLIYADDLAELYKNKSRLGGLLTKYLFTPLVAMLSDEIVATSHKLKEDMLRYNKNVVYIPNGVSLEKLKEGNKITEKERLTVCFVGGFGEWVNFDLIIGAAKEMGDIDFLLIGGGEQFNYVKEKTSCLENVKLTGTLQYEEVKEKLSEVNICVIPFKINRLTDRVSPIKLFEYWAMEKPVISTSFYEVKKIGDGKILFADTINEFKEKITMLKDAELRQELGEKGYKEVRNYDWELLGERYVGIINGMVK